MIRLINRCPNFYKNLGKSLKFLWKISLNLSYISHFSEKVRLFFELKNTSCWTELSKLMNFRAQDFDFFFFQFQLLARCELLEFKIIRAMIRLINRHSGFSKKLRNFSGKFIRIYRTFRTFQRKSFFELKILHLSENIFFSKQLS